MSDEQKQDAPKVKRFLLARLIKEAVRKIPNAIGWSLVKSDGRMVVKVEVESEGKS